MKKNRWTKSSFSNGSGGNNCVEIKQLDNTVLVRNSNDPQATTICFTYKEWNAFLKGANSGEFTLE